MIVVKIVEIIPDRGKEMALEGCLAVKFQFQYIELNVEQLFKFKPVLCLAEHIRVFREMDVVQGLVQVDQVVFFDEPCREGFLNPAVDSFENIRLYLVDQPGGQVTFFHLLRGRVDGLETYELLGTRFVQVHFRVDDVHLVVEDGGFAENQVLLVGGDLAGEVFVAREPNELQFPGPVISCCDHAHLFAYSDGREVCNFGFYLNIGKV